MSIVQLGKRILPKVSGKSDNHMEGGGCFVESIDIFLLDPVNGVPFQFPVNPPEITRRGEAQIETVEIARLGEVDWFTGNKRTVVSWYSFLPGHYDQHYCRYASIPDPMEATERLIAWRTSGTVLRLIITGVHRGRRRDLVNAPVLMPVFSPTHKGGEPHDVYYEITLRQYVEVQIRSAAEAGSEAGTRLDLAPVPGRYTVKEGDTLYLIAKQHLGYGEKWPDIYALNTDTVGPDPNTITAGMVLVMPGGGAPPSTVPPAVATEETPKYTASKLAQQAAAVTPE